MTRLQVILGLEFSEPRLLQRALTHRSFINEHEGTHLDCYERMEFLGDAIIQQIVSEEVSAFTEQQSQQTNIIQQKLNSVMSHSTDTLREIDHASNLSQSLKELAKEQTQLLNQFS